MRAQAFVISIGYLSIMLNLGGCQTNNPQNAREAEILDSQLASVAAFLDQGQPVKALRDLKEILRIHPQDHNALNLMGLTQIALKNPSRAVVYLQKAYKISPKTGVAVNLSSALIQAKKYTAARKVLNAARQQQEDPPYPFPERIYHNLAIAAFEQGQYNEAEAQLKLALEENPAFYLSRLQLAKLYDVTRRPENAASAFEDAHEACRVCFEPVSFLTIHYLQKGNVQKAKALVKIYRQTPGIQPEDQKKVAELEEVMARPAGPIRTQINPAKIRR